MSCACHIPAPRCDDGHLRCLACGHAIGDCPGCWDCQDPDVYGEDEDYLDGDDDAELEP